MGKIKKITDLSISRVLNDDHWTTEEIERLRKITSFDEMVPVAVDILQRMAATGKTIVQLCGPMSTGGKGSLDANMRHFHKAIDVARQQGLLVFDQTPFQEAMSRLAAEHENKNEYCMEILDIFYRGVFKSGLVSKLIFLPDWQSSKGASWEWQEAEKLGVARENYPAEWLVFLET